MSLRETNVTRLAQKPLDVLIIGAGINGGVSAASLAAKGAKVGLIDRGDFASETSSQSSNLAWGGIKYLESHDYRLVNKLCKSRNHLMKSYPSTVKEIRFLTTIAIGFRFPAFLVFLGTILYWFFGRCFTQAPAYFSPSKLKRAEPTINTDNVQGGFEYSDCYLHDNDSRFVFNFIRSSMDNGCASANYVESLGSERKQGLWHTKARDLISGSEFIIVSKVLINACGPSVDKHNQLIGQHTEYHHVFSKGIHLVVDRISEVNKVLTFFASDGRLFFVMPMGPKTCIGTTDDQVDKPFATIDDSDREFVLNNVNALLKLEKPLTKQDIISERCGVRPLAIKGEGGVADWVKLSRKHEIEVNSDEVHLSIFGGKLTDCINVGNEVANLVAQLGVNLTAPKRKWYGEPNKAIKRQFMIQAQAMGLDDMTPESSSEPLSDRLWRRYGRHALELLEAIRVHPSQAKLLIDNAEYLRCEVELAARHEMIVTLDDFLRRRSKISLVVRHNDLINDKGLKQACDILFGELADEKRAQYLAMKSSSGLCP